MPLVSASTKTLQIKIVYYGPGLSGKTTNLEQLNHVLAKERVGEMMSLDTKGDRTLFFDWMPLDLGKIRGFDVRIQLYTVPGQVRYNKTRKQVLRGVDGVVFVADSQKAAAEQNQYSFSNLRENLIEQGLDLEEVPLVIQCNKKDLPETMSTREMAVLLGAEHVPFTEAVAFKGTGVSETLRLITRITLKAVQGYFSPAKISQMKDVQTEGLDGETLLENILLDEGIQQDVADHERESAEEGQVVAEIEAEPSDEMEIEVSQEAPAAAPPEEVIEESDVSVPDDDDAEKTPVAIPIEDYMGEEQKKLAVPSLSEEFARRDSTPEPKEEPPARLPTLEIEAEPVDDEPPAEEPSPPEPSPMESSPVEPPAEEPPAEEPPADASTTEEPPAEEPAAVDEHPAEEAPDAPPLQPQVTKEAEQDQEPAPAEESPQQGDEPEKPLLEGSFESAVSESDFIAEDEDDDELELGEGEGAALSSPHEHEELRRRLEEQVASYKELENRFEEQAGQLESLKTEVASLKTLLKSFGEILQKIE